MSDIAASIIVKVYVVGGEVLVHTYPVPTTHKEVTSLIKSLVKQASILRRGYGLYLFFNNPSICYNPDNVIAVEINALGVKELETIMRKAQASIGFIKK